MMWYNTGNGPAWMFGMLGMWVFGFALLGVGIWALTRWLLPVALHHATPLETLQTRYARGEIDTLTFTQMREHLRGSNEPPSTLGQHV